MPLRKGAFRTKQRLSEPCTPLFEIKIMMESQCLYKTECIYVIIFYVIMYFDSLRDTDHARACTAAVHKRLKQN